MSFFPTFQLAGLDPLGIAIIVILVGALVILYLFWMGKAIFKKPLTGVESLVGKRGIATMNITLEGGEVSVDGIVWKAKLYSENGAAITMIQKGEPTIVVSVSSLTLLVKREN
ncbi:MAG TPA: NfeD family protein [Nitrososphaerales archaeon]|nr:NfeD family protein [Nitrososphaerales archaeon]